MVVLKTLLPNDPTVSFVAALEEPGKGFFQAFLASTPHHPILEYALERMVTHYEMVLVKPQAYLDAQKNRGLEDEGKREELDPDDKKARNNDMDDDENMENFPEVPHINYTYRNKLLDNDPDWRMGERTLKESYAALPVSAQGNVLLLQEIHLNEDHTTWYPDLERRESPEGKCCCNYVVHDPSTGVVHFWSKSVGTVFC